MVSNYPLRLFFFSKLERRGLASRNVRQILTKLRGKMKDARGNKTWDGAPALPPPNWAGLSKLLNLSGPHL